MPVRPEQVQAVLMDKQIGPESSLDLGRFLPGLALAFTAENDRGRNRVLCRFRPKEVMRGHKCFIAQDCDTGRADIPAAGRW